MRALEDELGYALFSQKGRGLELTEQGKSLYERLPAVLAPLDDLLAQIAPKKEMSRLLRIASYEVFTTYFLSSVISDRFNDWSIEMREALPGQIEALIGDGKSDIGLTYLAIPHPNVEFIKCGRVKMGIYGLKGNWSKTPVEEMPFAAPINPIEGVPSGAKGLDGWPEHLFERKVKYRVDMMETAMQLCRSGVAVAFLPDFVVRIMNEKASADSKLAEIAPPKEVGTVFREVFLVHRKGREEAKASREIAKALRALE